MQSKSCRSRNEDGGHAIQSAVAENAIIGQAMLHANFTALYNVIETDF